MKKLLQGMQGFTIAEVALACVIFPIIVIGIANSYNAVRKSYSVARQLNEMYTVLSACPELDRALEYTSITATSNCYPINVFNAEGGSGNTITYTPTLSVVSTTDLPVSDPLQTIPDSKVVEVSVGYQGGGSAPPLKLRMLITRNGIGQL